MSFPARKKKKKERRPLAQGLCDVFISSKGTRIGNKGVKRMEGTDPVKT